MINNSKGAALPLAVITMLVVSLLGAGLWQYSTSDTIQVARQENKMKAFYIARSGAEATAQWMAKPGNNGEALVGQTSSSNTFEDGTYIVKVIDAPENRVIIESTATVNGVPTQVALLLRRVTSFTEGSPMFENAIFGTELVVIGGTTTVDGNVESGGTLSVVGNVTINGDDKVTLGKTYPDEPFPEDLTYVGDFVQKTGAPSTHAINQGWYGTIDTNNRTLTFTPNGGTLRVRLDTLQTRNTDIEVIGEGNVIVYVESTFDHKGSVICSPNQFLVYLAPGSTASLPKGNMEFNGFLYGPNATVIFDGTQNFHGAIIAGKVYTHGTTGIYYNLPDGDNIISDGETVSSFETVHWLSP
jgi:hypothetical protein